MSSSMQNWAIFIAALGASAAAQVPVEGEPSFLPAAASGDEAPRAVGPLSIEWRVDRRFRLWGGGSARAEDDSEKLYEELRASSNANLIHDRIVAFLETHADLHKSVDWEPSEGGYRPTYLFPRSYIVRLRVPQAAGSAAAQCWWKTSTGTLLLPGPGTAPCADSVQLVLPAARDRSGSLAASVEVALVGGAGPASAPVLVQVRDRLIVSLGDSFASGEGNPDVPANLGMLQGGPGQGWSDDWRRRWLARGAMTGVRSPSWLDTPCHRSFYNQHLVAALKYAADRPHEAVTFVSYACSGAAIFDGLLTHQEEPPGYFDGSAQRAPKLAQVEALARDLCLPTAIGDPGWREERRKYEQVVGERNGLPLIKVVKTKAVACATSFGRSTDAVLLTIGGNDAGFARIIMWALLPRKMDDFRSQTALNVLRNRMTLDPMRAGPAIRVGLPANLKLLDARLGEVAAGARVLQSAYPAPLYGSDGGLCGPEDESKPGAKDHPSLLRLLAPLGLWPESRALPSGGWEMSIDRLEGSIAEAQVVNPLNRTIAETAATRPRWRFVGDFVADIRTHGWCAGDGLAEDAHLPDWAGAAWEPWNPHEWRAYKPRARYFRTPNDTALTLALESPRPLPLLLRVPLGSTFGPRHTALLASLAGSFHPTFEAHTVMGLSVARALESELAGAEAPQ